MADGGSSQKAGPTAASPLELDRFQRAPQPSFQEALAHLLQGLHSYGAAKGREADPLLQAALLARPGAAFSAGDRVRAHQLARLEVRGAQLGAWRWVDARGAERFSLAPDFRLGDRAFRRDHAHQDARHRSWWSLRDRERPRMGWAPLEAMAIGVPAWHSAARPTRTLWLVKPIGAGGDILALAWDPEPFACVDRAALREGRSVSFWPTGGEAARFGCPSVPSAGPEAQRGRVALRTFGTLHYEVY